MIGNKKTSVSHQKRRKDMPFAVPLSLISEEILSNVCIGTARPALPGMLQNEFGAARRCLSACGSSLWTRLTLTTFYHCRVYYRRKGRGLSSAGWYKKLRSAVLRSFFERKNYSAASSSMDSSVVSSVDSVSTVSSVDSVSASVVSSVVSPSVSVTSSSP